MYQFPETSSKPDYSDLNFWAAHPYKQDLSDSIPQALVNSVHKDSSVDVFFLHPTTLTDNSNESWNPDINDPVINAKTDYTTILYQASAFNEYRVFAPRYRQAHLRSYFTADTARAREAFDLAYEDIKIAFQYYLDHYNNGRPIIIASHSQGSTHALRLLKDFFENSPLTRQLVVAYIIGMYIPPNYFSALKMCKDSVETGCLCGWRTFQKGYEPDLIKKEKDMGWVNNPLTWTLSHDYASNSLNKGAVLRDFTQVYPGMADAQINEGILWIHKPRFRRSIFLRMKNYHVADINLFYVNIRQNLRQRVAAYRDKH